MQSVRYNKNTHQSGLRILFGEFSHLWNYDRDKLCYITPYPMCWQMAKWAHAYYQRYKIGTLVVWDMFGGIGTDSIQLAEYFNVITTEVNQSTYELLKKNMVTFRSKNVNVLHENCFNLIGKLEPDLIYFDPPWGDYYKPKMKNFDFSQVYLDYPRKESNELRKRVSCTDLVEYLSKKVCGRILIKSPLNSVSYEKIFGDRIVYIMKCQHKNLKFIYIDLVRI